MTETVTEFQLPERFDPQEELGRGGMGVVWYVIDRQFDRPLAVKMMLPEIVSHKEAVARFEREAHLTGSLQHPAIPAVVDRGLSADGAPYFSLKLIEGETLATLLKQRESVQEALPRFLSIFEQVCQAVGYAHSQGIIHRDLKPANIMVGAFGEVQVMDWGMAKRIDEEELAVSAGSFQKNEESEVFDPEQETVLYQNDSESTKETDDYAEHVTLTQAGQVLGTLAYMPPEQAQGDPNVLDARADVFSLGGILCKMLTGQAPYTGSDRLKLFQRVLSGDLDETHEALDNCDADQELIDLCRSCLAKNTVDRPRSGSEVADAVRDYSQKTRERLEQEKTERAAADARTEEEKKRRKVTMLAMGLALVLFLGAGLAGWWYQREETAKAKRDTEEQVRIAREQAIQDAREQQAKSDINSALEQVPKLYRNFEFEAAAELLTQAENRLEVFTKAETLSHRVEQTKRDLQLVEELDRIQLKKLIAVNRDLNLQYGTGTQGEFAQAFTAYGLNILQDDPRRLGETIRKLTIKPEILAGLYSWRLHEQPPISQQVTEVLKYSLLDEAHKIEQWFEVSDSPQKWVKWQQLAMSPMLVRIIASDLARGEKKRQAVELMKMATLSYPTEFALHLSLATNRDWLHDHPQAQIGHCRAALTIRPNSAPVHVTLGLLLFQENRYQEAEQAFRNAIDLNPQSGMGYYSLALVLNDLNRFQEAEAAIKRVIQIDATDAHAYQLLGRILTAMNRPEDAQNAYRTALQIDPELTSAQTLLNALLNKGNTGSVSPVQTADEFVMQGDAFVKQRRSQDAEQAYRAAIRQDEKNITAHNKLGKLLMMLKRTEEAETILRAALTINSNHADTHANMGYLFATLQRDKEAEDAYLTAIRLNPVHLHAVANLGALYQRQRKFSEMVALYQKALKTPEADRTFRSMVLNELGSTFARIGDHKKSEDIARMAIRLSPDIAQLRGTLGLALRNQQRYEESLTEFRMGLKLAEPNSPMHQLFEEQIQLTVQQMDSKQPVIAPRP